MIRQEFAAILINHHKFRWHSVVKMGQLEERAVSKDKARFKSHHQTSSGDGGDDAERCGAVHCNRGQQKVHRYNRS